MGIRHTATRMRHVWRTHGRSKAQYEELDGEFEPWMVRWRLMLSGWMIDITKRSVQVLTQSTRREDILF